MTKTNELPNQQGLDAPLVSKRFTPKEKAWELWNYYGTLYGRYDKAGQGAIRAVEEIMTLMKNDDEQNDDFYWANHNYTVYWNDVIVELRKLS
jgi:hypothetical protein